MGHSYTTNGQTIANRPEKRKEDLPSKDLSLHTTSYYQKVYIIYNLRFNMPPKYNQKKQETGKYLEETIKLESNYVNRFEKEGRHKTWSYIIGNSFLSGLLGTFLIDSFTDSQYMVGIGSFAAATFTGYIFYKESKKRIKEDEYKAPAIMK